MKLTSHHQPEEFGKGQKEMPHVLPTSQNPPHWSHLGWVMCTSQGRTLSQIDWPETTWKLIPLPQNLRLRATEVFRTVLLGSFTLLISTWLPLPNKVSCFVSTCVSSDNSFPSVRQEPLFRPWKWSPFMQQNLPALWSWASQPLELWETIVCWLNQSVCGIFLL